MFQVVCTSEREEERNVLRNFRSPLVSSRLHSCPSPISELVESIHKLNLDNVCKLDLSHMQLTRTEVELVLKALYEKEKELNQNNRTMNLIMLDLRMNNFDGLKGLQLPLSLTSLYIGGTHFNDNSLNTLDYLSLLESLHIDNINNEQLKRLPCFSKLRSLTLQGNNLTLEDIGKLSLPSTLSQLTLQGLEAYRINNQIAIHFPEFLEVLDLSYSKFTDESLSTLRFPPHLKKLILTKNRVSLTAWDISQLPKSLEELKLDHNIIGKKGVKKSKFNHDIQLKYLDLNNNLLGNEGLQNLVLPANLTDLVLSNNYIFSEALVNRSWPLNLAILDLSYNNINSSGLSYIEIPLSLKTLKLKSNQIDGEGVLNLRKQLLSPQYSNSNLLIDLSHNLVSLQGVNITEGSSQLRWEDERVAVDDGHYSYLWGSAHLLWGNPETIPEVEMLADKFEISVENDSASFTSCVQMGQSYASTLQLSERQSLTQNLAISRAIEQTAKRSGKEANYQEGVALLLILGFLALTFRHLSSALMAYFFSYKQNMPGAQNSGVSQDCSISTKKLSQLKDKQPNYRSLHRYLLRHNDLAQLVKSKQAVLRFLQQLPPAKYKQLLILRQEHFRSPQQLLSYLPCCCQADLLQFARFTDYMNNPYARAYLFLASYLESQQAQGLANLPEQRSLSHLLLSSDRRHNIAIRCLALLLQSEHQRGNSKQYIENLASELQTEIITFSEKAAECYLSWKNCTPSFLAGSRLSVSANVGESLSQNKAQLTRRHT